jgi:guanine deaminase
VFCPTSNLFLGSGLFPYQQNRKRLKALRIATATDVGGGTSVFDAAHDGRGLQDHRPPRREAEPFASFWQITRGNAEALSLSDRIGTLEEARMPTSSCSTPRRRRL